MHKIQGMAALIEKAKDDPAFFHNLVWDTEKALADVGFLSRSEKASIMSIEPEELVIGMATGNFNGVGDLTSNCGTSCGGSCGGSCGISCGVSCATSCAVSELMPVDPGLVSNPADTARENLIKNIDAEISNVRFNRFRR